MKCNICGGKVIQTHNEKGKKVYQCMDCNRIKPVKEDKTIIDMDSREILLEN